MASNPLADLIPAAYRKYVYLVAAAAVFVYALWEASSGDWRSFVVALVSSLVPALAASNTPTTVPDVLDEVEDVADETNYDGHGGF